MSDRLRPGAKLTILDIILEALSLRRWSLFLVGTIHIESRSKEGDTEHNWHENDQKIGLKTRKIRKEYVKIDFPIHKGTIMEQSWELIIKTVWEFQSEMSELHGDVGPWKGDQRRWRLRRFRDYIFT